MSDKSPLHMTTWELWTELHNRIKELEDENIKLKQELSKQDAQPRDEYYKGDTQELSCQKTPWNKCPLVVVHYLDKQNESR